MSNLFLLLTFISLHQLIIAQNDTECGSSPGICWLIGDPHIRKFDGNEYLFSISGAITALTDQKSVWVRLEIKETERASSILAVKIDFIYQDGSQFGKRTQIVMEKDVDHIMINGQIRDLPYENLGVRVSDVGLSALVDFEGIHIKWINSAKLFIVVDPKFAGDVDGECGYFCTKAPWSKGYLTATKTYSTAQLQLYSPYDRNTNLEERICTFIGPHCANVTITDEDDVHTSLVLKITMVEDAPTKAIQEEIKSKLEDANIGTVIENKIEKVVVFEPAALLSQDDFPLPQFIKDEEAAEA